MKNILWYSMCGRVWWGFEETSCCCPINADITISVESGRLLHQELHDEKRNKKYIVRRWCKFHEGDEWWLISRMEGFGLFGTMNILLLNQNGKNEWCYSHSNHHNITNTVGTLKENMIIERWLFHCSFNIMRNTSSSTRLGQSHPVQK